MEMALSKIDKVLYTGRTHTTGARDGAARSDDARLDVQLSPPGSMGAGTNPEQLFAAGWSACFIGAMRSFAASKNIVLPKDLAVDAEIDLATGDGGFSLQGRLNVSLPGVALETAREIVEGAHLICPYSKATRNNIDVTLNLI